MDDSRERKDKLIAMFTSLGIHSALVLAFLFIMAWRAPDPPFPEYGIEVNFGLDDQGTGDIQPETPANAEEVPNEQATDQTEAVAEETTEESKPTEEVVRQQVTEEESPVVVKETKKEPEVKPAPKEEKEEKKPAVSEARPTEDKGNPKPANQGDDKGKVGDKGSEEGTLNQSTVYSGKTGGGDGGVGLDLAGWNWDEIPKPDIPNNEPGKIVFEIKVDENGEIRGIRVLEKTLSSAAEKACRDAIAKLTFSKKSGAVVPEMSTGKITFTVVTK